MSELGGMMPTVRVTRIWEMKEDGGAIRAFADVVVAEQFAVRGIRIMEGSKGMFVSMPGRKAEKDEYVDIFFPITAEARKLLHTAVMAAYQIQRRKTEVMQ